MYAKFIGTVAAAAITITAIGAAPARADDRDRDVARALAALLGVAVVGTIINKRKDGAQHHVQPQAVHNPPRPRHPRTYATPRPQHVQPQVKPRPLPRNVNPRPRHNASKRFLPGQCLRTFDSRRGTYRGFGRRCLERNYDYTHRLPQNCRVKLRTHRGKRVLWEARCLRQEGYRLARR